VVFYAFYGTAGALSSGRKGKPFTA